MWLEEDVEWEILLQTLWKIQSAAELSALGWGGCSIRDSSVDLRKAISKSREISFLYCPIKSNIALYIVYKVQYGLLDFAKGLVLTQENDNPKNLLFRLEVALFRCIDLALTEQAPQFQGPSSVFECCQVVRVSLPFHGGNAQAQSPPKIQNTVLWGSDKIHNFSLNPGAV